MLVYQDALHCKVIEGLLPFPDFYDLYMILRRFTLSLLLGIFVAPVAQAINLPLADLDEMQLSLPATLGDKTLGTAISLSGSIAAVAALPDDNFHTGSVYLYDGQQSWALITEITSQSETDNFARHIELVGNTLVVSADRDDADGVDSGTVYIFERSAGNTWQQTAQLTAPDVQTGDQFGSAISLLNNVLYIGAPFHGQGKVYMYTQDVATAQWSLQQTIEPDDPQALRFGAGIAQDAQTLIIGAPYTDAKVIETSSAKLSTQAAQPRFQISRGDTFDPGFESGAIFVYENTSGIWKSSVRIEASNRETGDHLGEKIAIEGDLIIASIKNKDVFDFLGSGAVYVYRKVAQNWIEDTALFPDDSNLRAQFGVSFSVLDQHILVGANKIHANGFNSGMVYLFGQDANQHWSMIHQQTNAALQAHDFFGSSVALGAEQILAASKHAVYVFQNTSEALIPAIYYTESQILQLNELAVAGIGVFSATLQLSQSGNTALLTLTASHMLASTSVSDIQYLAATGEVIIPRLAVPQSSGEMTFFTVTLQQQASASSLQFYISSIQPINP